MLIIKDSCFSCRSYRSVVFMSECTGLDLSFIVVLLMRYFEKLSMTANKLINVGELLKYNSEYYK